MFHLFFVIAWFAGIFYLPRLFVYHTQVTGSEENNRFKLMERRLYGMMNIGAAGSVIAGVVMLYAYAWASYKSSGWLHAKLSLVVLLIIYHGYLGYLLRQLANDANSHGESFYRVLNELPVILLLGILILVVIKPF